jgi:uncharacterized protein YlaN (UPF0358 family)
MNISLHYKYDSKIIELREDLTENFEFFEKQLDKFLDSKEKELLYNFKNNFYPLKQKFSDICIDIQDSIVLTDDEANQILNDIKVDMDNIFFSYDKMFDDLLETLEDHKKTTLCVKEIKHNMNKKFLSFDKKLTNLYEKINT